MKPKPSTRKRVIKTGGWGGKGEVSEVETNREKKTKNQLFEKSDQIDKPVVRLAKQTIQE